MLQWLSSLFLQDVCHAAISDFYFTILQVGIVFLVTVAKQSYVFMSTRRKTGNKKNKKVSLNFITFLQIYKNGSFFFKLKPVSGARFKHTVQKQ